MARSVSQLPPVLWIKSFHGSECTRTLAHTHLLASPPSICVDLHFHFTRVTVLLSTLLRRRSDMCQFYQVTGDGGDGGDRLPVGRRPSETGSQTALLLVYFHELLTGHPAAADAVSEHVSGGPLRAGEASKHYCGAGLLSGSPRN